MNHIDFPFCTYIVLYILYMMTSLGSERARGTRDKVQTPATQTQPQKQVQATAEQIRLAQMIYDKNDADFEDKVKQLMEVTGKNQDECIVALHDCNEDVTRAINILLEGNSDTTSWETVGKKKSLGKDGSENKENREKRGEREMSRGRGGASRRGRGASRGRELRTEENGVDLGPGDRVSDRGRRGRGRGFGGRGRGRAAGGSRFSAQGMGVFSPSFCRTFNPADYTDSSASGGGGSKTEAWESGNDGDDGTGAWRSTMDDWAAEDWNEDLSETKVFTASSASPNENHITPGQSIDLVALLQKPAAGGGVGELNSYDPSQQHQQQSLGNSLVFTNSQIPSGTSNATAVNPYSHHMLSSVLSSGFGELGSSKLPSSAGAQTLEQLKSPGMGPLSSQQIGVSAVGGSSSVSTSSWDIKPLGSQTTVLSQFSFKTQPEPSPVLSQLTQRQQQQQPSLSLSSQSSLSMLPPPPGLDTYPPQTKLRDPTPPDSAATAAIVTAAKLLHMPPGAIDTQAGSTQQKQLKLQKRRIPPTSKIPSSAVEMPASADVTGLTFQFGALEFGSEPSLQEFGSAESNSDTPSQTQNSLYSKPVSDSLSSSLSMPISAPDSSYSPPVVTSSSLPALPQSSAPPVTSPGPSLEQNAVHSRIAFQSSLAPSPQEEPPAPTTVSNGFNGVRTPTGLDTTSTASTPKPESPSLPSSLGPLSSSAPAASALLPTSVPQHSTALTSMGQNSELSTAPLPQLSNSLSNHQNSHSPASVLSSSSSHTYTSVDSVSSLQPSSNFSAASTCSSSNASAMVNVANTLHMTSSLGLSSNSVSIPSATRSAHLLSSTAGKAPPNLPQGVPPLLHNQYIVGPGGLLPAYPQIYGYEDLQMLQSRLPMDYYGIPFPGPTATLPGRDGSLANNPYSGEVTKFGRGDSASPAPTTSLAQPLQQQSQTQQTHHTTQQAFLNPALPPGYSYTGLPYYPGMPGVPSAFQYGPTMFVPPASAKQHGVGLNNPSTPFQQASGYGQHGYGSGYDDLTQGTGGGEYSKGGYSGSSQAQAKSAGSGPGKGVSVTSSNTGVPDISGSVYNKTQSFDKQGFHAGTPPPFSLPSALGGTGPLNPGAAQGYAPAPFLHILPAHQQPHSQMLHHHLQQDGQGGSGQRSQPNSMQQKSQANKSTYGSSPYWGN
ncbi:ubiquitin-associated protein 2 isoform X3 [Acipenser ruthenus]|uniref:ubiquitin-associated protein 2 isoform X3 n=1 Tax=Acipenser ruthenus TaxID=7906 RepID=UPI002741206C|nr:ubiquitin-associated protein 2 isoform X3 [Acipenser ruthenus]